MRYNAPVPTGSNRPALMMNHSFSSLLLTMLAGAAALCGTAEARVYVTVNMPPHPVFRPANGAPVYGPAYSPVYGPVYAPYYYTPPYSRTVVINGRNGVTVNGRNGVTTNCPPGDHTHYISTKKKKSSSKPAPKPVPGASSRSSSGTAAKSVTKPSPASSAKKIK